jgi:hypothetical protein
MRSRVTRLLALLSLLVAPLVVASSTQPAQADYRWCADVGGVGPCIVSLKRDGVLITSHVTYNVNRDTYDVPSGEYLHNTGFTVTGLTAADVGHEFEVVMKTGGIKPRVISGWGADPTTNRSWDGSDWVVTVRADAVKMIQSCNNLVEPLCDYTGEPGSTRYEMQANINDADWYSTDPTTADQLHGLDQFSNINLFWYPPAITTSSTGAVTMDFLMQNAHEFEDGTTVFQGQADIRLPNRVLRAFYGIPNPETMVDGSFTSTSTSGTVSSAQELGDDAWLVDVSNVTFSKRHLKLTRGVIVPKRPTNLVPTRIDAHTGKVAFTKAQARGALPTGYKIRCESGGGHVVTNTKTTPTSPIRIGGLRTGVGYDCKVRATSKAGLGTWSLVVRMRARP